MSLKTASLRGEAFTVCARFRASSRRPFSTRTGLGGGMAIPFLGASTDSWWGFTVTTREDDFFREPADEGALFNRPSAGRAAQAVLVVDKLDRGSIRPSNLNNRLD
jgi:hypothetical protein